MLENILPILKQIYPMASILVISNIGTLVYFKMKNKSKKIEIMNVRSEIRKIRRMEEAERNNKIF